MNCPNCGTERSGYEQFCSRCGVQIVSITPSCQNCGAELSQQSTFCSQCGFQNAPITPIQTGNSTYVTVFMVLMIVGGIISLLLGNYLNNSLEAQLLSMYHSGTVNPGNTYFVIGALLLIAGVTIIIVKQLKKGK